MKKRLFLVVFAATFLLTACEGISGVTDSIPETSIETSVDSSNGGGNSSVGDSSDESFVEHTDGDNNGFCDSCGESVVVTFDVFAVNDLHGKFDDTPGGQPGVDEMSTYFKQQRADNENTIILSSGDMWQGGAVSNLTKGAIMVEWMNEMDFASMTLGNHEYDWGEEYIANNQKLAEFPFLALNIFNTETGKPVEYCQPSVMVKKNGAQIGIIGAIGDVRSSISAYMVEGVEFKVGEELTNLVKAEADKLRAQGADCIIYSIHDTSQTGYDISLSDGYVDIVFEGHSHQAYTVTDTRGVYHVQGGGDNRVGLSHAEIEINTVKNSANVKNAGIVEHSEYVNLADHPVVESLKKKYEKEIAIAYETLGVIEKTLYGDEILNTCAQLYYEAGMEKWGKKSPNIFLGGGYMNVRSPGVINQGAVTYSELIDILPFDNQLVLCSLSGAKLKEAFIDTTKDTYYMYYSEYGETNKNSINLNQTYYIVTDRYTSQYKPNGLTEIEFYDDRTYARDLLAQHIKEGAWGVDWPKVEEKTISEIIELGNALVDNGETAEKYRVSGEIVNIEPIKEGGIIHYGNMTIKDAVGNTLYIYGTYDKNGNVYGDMEIKPQVGDTVTLGGVIKKYVNGTTVKVEMLAATVLEHTVVGNENPTIEYEEITIAQAIEIGETLADNEQTNVNYKVSGEILEIVQTYYGNMTIKDNDGNTLYIYGTYDENGIIYGSMEKQPQVGDTVTIGGVIKKFVKDSAVQIEIINGTFLTNTTDGEQTPVEPQEITIAEAIEIAENKEHDTYTEEKYYVTGKVIAFASTVYGNFYLADQSGAQIYVYGLHDESGNRYDAMTTKPVIGDTVTLLTTVGQYNGIYELKDSVLVEYTDGGVTDINVISVTIPKIMEIGDGMTDNTVTEQFYFLSGTIVEIFDEKNGNMTIEDGEGNKLYLYNLIDDEGKSYENMENSPVVGDTINVYGQIKFHPAGAEGQKIQLYRPILYVGETISFSPITIGEALNIGGELAAGEKTEAYYLLTGTVTEIVNTTDGNMFIQDEEGNKIYLYAPRGASGTTYNQLSYMPQVGDIVSVYGQITNYATAEEGKKIQLSHPVFYSIQANEVENV